MRICFSGRTYRSRRKKAGAKRVFAILLLLLLLFGLERRLPQLPDAVWETALQRYAQTQIAETVSGYLAKEPLLSDGKTLTLDAYALGTLQTKLTAALQDALTGRAVVRIPLGSLTGAAALNGRGPKLPLTLSAESAVQVTFESTLNSAGINRTRYGVVMRVTAQMCSVSARFPGTVQAEAVIPVYESVLEGDIPQYNALQR